MKRLGQLRTSLAGFDINGWWDRAVRNWRLTDDGTVALHESGWLVDGGPLSCTVRTGSKAEPSWFAGPGARLAPHGRGGGWGLIGASDLRRSLRGAFLPEDWGLTLQRLAPHSSMAVLGIPDLPAMDDAAREARLEAMRMGGVRRPLLTWSSILVCLNHCSSAPLHKDMCVGVVEHDPQGLRVQVLKMRERDGVLVPMRRKVGQLLPSPIGLAMRERRIAEDLARAAGDDRVAQALALADLPGLLALDGPGHERSELIRLENGDWVEVSGRSPDLPEPPELPAGLSTCDEVLVHGPGSEALTLALRDGLNLADGVAVDVAAPDAVARGSLVAAERLRDGIPIWFDFLPKLDTIVLERRQAKSCPLVGEDEDVEGGRDWRSPSPIKMYWPAGGNELRVWLRKEDAAHPRKAPAHIQRAPERNVEVLLHVEQSPAQGRAKLTLESREWAPLRENPAIVRWEDGDEDYRDWKTIIAAESLPPPSIPDRVILSAHRDMWYGANDLAGKLDSFDGHDFAPIAKALTHRSRLFWQSTDPVTAARQYYAVDSDGGRPDGVSDRHWDRLLEILGLAERQFLAGTNRNNDALRVLTWCFHLCPATVWPPVVAALTQEPGPDLAQGWQIIFPQGLGRIAKGGDAFRATISYLNGLPLAWNRNQQACASFLLSRNDDVFACMDRATIEQWAHMVQELMDQQRLNLESRSYIYLPTLIAGLVRWRLVEPTAFLMGEDPLADVLAQGIDQILEAAETTPLTKFVASVVQGYSLVRAYLDDQNVQPDILIRLFDLT